MEVSWDGETNVDVYIPADYKGKTCGLCGNYNDNPNDDTLNPNGQLVRIREHTIKILSLKYM